MNTTTATDRSFEFLQGIELCRILKNNNYTVKNIFVPMTSTAAELVTSDISSKRIT